MKTTKIIKILKGLGCAGILALFSVSGHATVISSGSNNPLAFSWDFFDGTSHLKGTGSLTVSGFSSSTLTVAVTLTNNAPAGGNGGDRLTAFGFGINPNATSVSFSDAPDAGMVGASLSSIPSLASIEVCSYGGNNCAGGANGGIFGAGGFDTFSILLNGTWGSSVDIAPIGFKYQTARGSSEFTASSSGTTSGDPVPTPEPSSLALLGLGAIASVFSLRRRPLKA